MCQWSLTKYTCVKELMQIVYVLKGCFQFTISKIIPKKPNWKLSHFCSDFVLWMKWNYILDHKHLLNVHLTYREHFSGITNQKILYIVHYMMKNAESGHTATYLSRQGKDLIKILSSEKWNPLGSFPLKTAASSLIWISTGQKMSWIH